jgi:geranylgeranyl diphosphate synthase type II
MMQCPEDKLQAVLDVFTETTLEIDEGQQYDISFETRDDVREEEYIEMIRLKTSVLLACALKIGAILGGASASDAENLYKFGEQIGLAFQLQDDFLDVYGDPKVFGKAIGGDILCNKKTFMLINAFNKADEAQRKELEKWVNAVNPDPQQKIAAVTTLYNNIGVNRLAEERIRYYFDESRKYFAAVQVPEESKQELKAYTDKMMKRNK